MGIGVPVSGAWWQGGESAALIHRVIHHPIFEMLVGLILLAISLDELLEALAGDLVRGLGAAHGVALYGLFLFLFRTLQVLPYLAMGLLHLSRGGMREAGGGLRRMWERLERSPGLELAGGVLLALFAGFLAGDALFGELGAAAEPGTGHGLFLFGLFSMLKYVATVLEGLEIHRAGPFAESGRRGGWGARLSAVVHSFWLHLLMSAVLVGAPLLEMGEFLGAELFAADPDARHGSIVLGLFTFLKGLPDLYDAVEVLEAGEADRRASRERSAD